MELVATDEVLRAANTPGCMVDGNPAAPLLIIGMAPGREELAQNKPFMGGSGKLLWKQLAKHGISRADCYIINTIGEWPDGVDGNPTKAQFDKWWDTFDEAVSRSNAGVALLLGKAALERFTGLTGGIEDWRGYLITPAETKLLARTITRQAQYKTSNKKRGITKGDPKIEKVKAVVRAPWPPSLKVAIASIHPAAVLRTGFGTLPALAADIARASRAVAGTLVVTQPLWNDGLPEALIAPDGAPVVVDIETGGIDNGIITRIGSNDSSIVWTALWDDRAREALRFMLGRSSMTVAFNIGFDAPRLEAHGVPLPEPWWDVMLAAALCQPNLKKSLNYVASLYMDLPRWKHLSEDEPARYNAMDVWVTLQLYHILRAELQRTGQLELFEKRMMPTVPTLVRMTQRGWKVDEVWREKWMRELTSRRDELLERWEAIAPGQKTSGARLSAFLYGELGLPTWYHKHGGISSEVAGLKTLLAQGDLDSRQREVVSILLDLRGVVKELRTYAEVELGGDGRIHPGFLPAGKDTDSFGKGIAGTGRIIASGPNIQNQPQSARHMYVASSPDMILIEADFSQIEARIIAQLSGDDELRRAIDEGLHDSNMRVLGVDKTRAKNGFYGWAYGAGKRTLKNTFISRGFDVPESECEALLRGFDRRFARAAAWRRRVASELSTRYYLTNAFGRRRYFLGGSRDTPAGLDFHPQSCAADITWPVLRELEMGLRRVDANVLAIVHDSFPSECPRSAIRECAGIIREIMEQPWPELGGLIVPVEIKTGNDWGSMMKMEE